jgi:predicted nucleic acid-binding protein
MSSMTVSLDTNVLIALLNEAQEINRSALAAIERSRKLGKLVVSGPVYAELMGFPARTQAALDSFFNMSFIDVDWRFEEAVWRSAGAAFQSYVQRRVASTGLLPRRILTDFLIGAHTVVNNYTLLTLDKRHYEAAFPGIRLASF